MSNVGINTINEKIETMTGCSSIVLSSIFSWLSTVRHPSLIANPKALKYRFSLMKHFDNFRYHDTQYHWRQTSTALIFVCVHVCVRVHCEITPTFLNFTSRCNCTLKLVTDMNRKFTCFVQNHGVREECFTGRRKWRNILTQPKAQKFKGKHECQLFYVWVKLTLNNNSKNTSP